MLRVSSLNVEIAGIQILRDISIELSPGLTTVLIGRNGAGKTTLLRSIMGLLPVMSGRIFLGDIPISDEPAFGRARHGIGYAPEDRRLIPEFTVEENIVLPALALKLTPTVTQRRLEEVYALLPELRGMRKRPGGGVSGGQGKMVALGRALMVSEKLLMLDEPFQGLAPALALDYARTLDRLRLEKPELSLLITESSPKLLSNITDVTIQIERGAVSRQVATETAGTS